MAGKPLNRKSAAMAYEEGKTPDIAMPDFNEPTPIQEQSNPWDQQQAAPTAQFQVPDELPDEVQEAMEQEEQQEEPVKEQRSSLKDPSQSFAAIREAKLKAERERDEAMMQMLRLQQQYQQPQQQQQAPQESDDLDFDIDPEALVEGKHLKKLMQELKKTREQQKRYAAQSYEEAQTVRVKSQYPDFDQVVSPDNVAMLNEMYPEIARSLRDTPDLYDKATSAYTIIKNFGIHKENKYENERAKAVINAQKPRPLASVSPQQGDSPLSKANAFANGMTEDLKAQLRKEMFAARRAM